MQHAEIIAIGTELTSGAKLDTNSQWLSLQLADLGIPVRWHTTVADNLEDNIQAIRHAVERVDLVLISGGLGPTLDDLTREALAAVAGVELSLDPASLAHVEGFFRARGRIMPERNRSQALFPTGAVPIDNPIGTAPGIWLTLPREGRPPCTVAAMPGVPSELFKMFLEQIRPRLPGGQRLIRRARIHTIGLGESLVEELLGDLTARGHDPEIGITAHEATITLRIIAHGSNELECRSKIDAASQQIHERLGGHVFGYEDDELEDVVIRLLAERGVALLTSEVATDGLLAGSLAAAQRRWLASRVTVAEPAPCNLRPFQRGIVTDVPDAALRQFATSTAGDGLYQLQIGPEQRLPGQGGREVSRVLIELVAPAGESRVIQLDWTGNPAIFRSRTCKSALDILRRELLGLGLDLYLPVPQPS